MSVYQNNNKPGEPTLFQLFIDTISGKYYQNDEMEILIKSIALIIIQRTNLNNTNIDKKYLIDYIEAVLVIVKNVHTLLSLSQNGINIFESLLNDILYKDIVDQIDSFILLKHPDCTFNFVCDEILKTLNDMK